MVAMLAFGGTYAYFTSTAKGLEGTVHTGYVKLTNTATSVVLASNVLPGDSLLTGDLTYKVETTDELGNYVAIKVELTTGDDDKDTALKLSDLVLSNTTWNSLGGGIYYTKDPVANNASATVTAADLKLPTTVYDNWDSTIQSPAAENGLMDIDITVTITARSIQASNIAEGTLETAISGLFSA